MRPKQDVHAIGQEAGSAATPVASSTTNDAAGGVTDVDEVVVRDVFGRPLRDLRISVTDRCNFRCTYCMPKEVFGPDFAFLPQSAVLSFDEIVRSARLFTEVGVRKLRITGGEPLLRAKLEDLIARLHEIEGVEDIALTTNGSLLTATKAAALKKAGLNRVTVSLDSLDDETFMALNDVNFPVSRVLEAINNAANAGLSPVKVNMVVKRGHNDGSVLPMAEHFRGTGHVLRFIEFMDVGTTNGWRMDDVLTADEIFQTIHAQHPLEPVPANKPGEVARRYRYVDGQGEIGIIASVTKPFCGGCNRLRLSSDGQLYTCLFGSHGYDLRSWLRTEKTDDEIRELIASLWHVRDDRYSEQRSDATVFGKRVEMSRIGG